MRRLALLALMCFAPDVARAQRFQPEARFEVIGPEPYQGVMGVAVHVPAGRYVRIGLGGTGLAIRRTDLLARFTLDPFRQQRWALSVGGGISHDAESRDTFLALIADLEGPPMGGTVPFVSAALAGGPRFAVGIRRLLKGRR